MVKLIAVGIMLVATGYEAYKAAKLYKQSRKACAILRGEK